MYKIVIIGTFYDNLSYKLGKELYHLFIIIIINTNIL